MSRVTVVVSVGRTGTAAGTDEGSSGRSSGGAFAPPTVTAGRRGGGRGASALGTIAVPREATGGGAAAGGGAGACRVVGRVTADAGPVARYAATPAPSASVTPAIAHGRRERRTGVTG